MLKNSKVEIISREDNEKQRFSDKAIGFKMKNKNKQKIEIVLLQIQCKCYCFLKRIRVLSFFTK